MSEFTWNMIDDDAYEIMENLLYEMLASHPLKVSAVYVAERPCLASPSTCVLLFSSASLLVVVAQISN